jgi:hypothetical protein
MNATHTPGPWTLTREQWDTMGDAPRLFVRAHQGGTHPLIVHLDERDEGNANLITAAPELLAALKAMAKWGDEMCFPMGGKDDGPWESVDAAIAKAEGR